MTEQELQRRSYTARVLTHNTGEKIREIWTADKAYDNVKGNRFVVEVENTSNEKMIEKLSQLYPNENFVTKRKFIDNGSDLTWYVDAIDGTKYYIREIPLFSSSIALLKNGEPILGVVFNPVSHVMFWTHKYLNGVYRNYDLLQTSNAPEISECMASLDLPNFEKFSKETQEKILNKKLLLGKKLYRVRSFGCGMLGLTWLATSSLDAFIRIIPSNDKFILPYPAIALLNSLKGAYIEENEGNMNIFIAAKSKELVESIYQFIKES